MQEKKDELKHYTAFLKVFLILLWYYVGQYIVSWAVYVNIKDFAIYKEYVTKHQNTMLICIYLILFLGIWAFDQHKTDFIQAFKHWKLGSCIQYLLWGVLAYFVTTIITGILLPFFPEYSEIASVFEQKQIFLSFMGTVILAPIVEEYVFRHKIQGYFKQALNVKLAIVLQAVLFGILHGYVIQKIYALLVGFFFGIIDEKKQSIQPSIVMHMLINGIGWFIGSFLL